MKKAALLTIISLSSAALFAQSKSDKGNTFEVQVKGSGNSTWLFNKNISDADDTQDYDKAWGFNYGAAFNAYFGSVGVGIEVLTGNHRGGYAGTIGSTSYKSNVNLKQIMIPLLFKLRSANGAYFELGPEYNMVSSAVYSSSGSYGSSTKNVTSSYASSYISGVLGFGFKIRFGDSPLSMDAGLRLNYGLTDLKGVDSFGRELNNPAFYKKPEITNAASGGLVIALVYKLNK